MLQTLDISNYEFCYIKQSKFEISKGYIICRYVGIRKLDSIPLTFKKHFSFTLLLNFNDFNDIPVSNKIDRFC